MDLCSRSLVFSVKPRWPEYFEVGRRSRDSPIPPCQGLSYLLGIETGPKESQSWSLFDFRPRTQPALYDRSISSPTPLESSLWSPPSFYSIWTRSSLALLHRKHSEVPLATFFCRMPSFLSTGVLFLSPHFGGYSVVGSWKDFECLKCYPTCRPV